MRSSFHHVHVWCGKNLRVLFVAYSLHCASPLHCFGRNWHIVHHYCSETALSFGALLVPVCYGCRAHRQSFQLTSLVFRLVSEFRDPRLYLSTPSPLLFAQRIQVGMPFLEDLAHLENFFSMKFVRDLVTAARCCYLN